MAFQRAENTTQLSRQSCTVRWLYVFVRVEVELENGASEIPPSGFVRSKTEVLGHGSDVEELDGDGYRDLMRKSFRPLYQGDRPPSMTNLTPRKIQHYPGA